MKRLVPLICGLFASAALAVPPPPNIVLILADDLGPGELGCYGSTQIHTPNIDALAHDGIRFTQAYAPAPVCAPTRCSLLTGLHQGHAYIRDNLEIKPEGQTPLPAGTVTVAQLLKNAGYSTACIGKWGLGPVGSTGDPLKNGFDFFFGHNCQRVAHNHYTNHVWRNDDRVELDGKTYTPDLMADEAIKWVDAHHDKPFFLYFATPLPHVSLQAPEEDVAKYRGKFGPEKPAPKQGDYAPCPEPHATYAAMVTKIDDYVGRLANQIKQLKLDDNTVIIFASDNGPTYNAGTDSAFFNSTSGLRGLKEQLYEGGIRVPMIVRWPGHTPAGATSDLQTALFDLMPTALDLANQSSPERCDGISLLPTIDAHPENQRQHDYLYFESWARNGQKALRQGNWKAVRTGLRKDPNAPVQLYDLATDPDESTDVAQQHPDIVQKLSNLMREAHTPAAIKKWEF